MVASSGTWRKCGLRSSSSRIVITAIGVSKNWALCHPWKPVRQPPSKRPPELQNRVQTIRAGTVIWHDNHAARVPVPKVLAQVARLIGEGIVILYIDIDA